MRWYGIGDRVCMRVMCCVRCVLDTSMVLKQEVLFFKDLHSLSCQAFDARLEGRGLFETCEAAALGHRGPLG